MTFLESRAAWERDYWKRLLSECKGNVSQMARESGYCRPSIYKILERLQIQKQNTPGRGGNAAWRSLEG